MSAQAPSPIELQLLALVVSERSGREVAKLFEKETGHPISYGTLYTTYRRLREAGWVTVREDEDQDGRIRFFRITALGADALDHGRQYYAGLAAFGKLPSAASAGWWIGTRRIDFWRTRCAIARHLRRALNLRHVAEIQALSIEASP